MSSRIDVPTGRLMIADRVQTVARFPYSSWRVPNVHPGDRAVVVGKRRAVDGRGEQADVIIVAVDVEPLTVRSINPMLDRRYVTSRTGRPVVTVDDDECSAHGFDGRSPAEFAEWWASKCGYRDLSWFPTSHGFALWSGHQAVACKRIEWKYVDKGMV